MCVNINIHNTHICKKKTFILNAINCLTAQNYSLCADEPRLIYFIQVTFTQTAFAQMLK